MDKKITLKTIATSQTMLAPTVKAKTANNLKLKNDARLLKLEKFIMKMGYKRSALLEILHKAQEIYGYLSENTLTYIADAVELPLSHVEGVVTFYSHFKQKQLGEHVITACMGTACYVKGAEEIVAAIEKKFDVKRGESTADGKLSLFTTRCIGACAIGPAIVIDEKVVPNATKEIVLERISSVLERAIVETR